MAKVRKMANGGFMPPYYGNDDQSATGGLGRVNAGAGTIGTALKTAKSAIGGDNGSNVMYPIDLPQQPEVDYVTGPSRKKGGSIKKTKHMAGGGGMTIRAPDYPSDYGDNSAFGGLKQVNSGAGTVGTALKTASGAIGSDGSDQGFPNGPIEYKKGGSAKKADSGRIHIGTSKISTAQKNKKHSNCW